MQEALEAEFTAHLPPHATGGLKRGRLRERRLLARITDPLGMLDVWTPRAQAQPPRAQAQPPLQVLGLFQRREPEIEAVPSAMLWPAFPPSTWGAVLEPLQGWCRPSAETVSSIAHVLDVEVGRFHWRHPRLVPATCCPLGHDAGGYPGAVTTKLVLVA